MNIQKCIQLQNLLKNVTRLRKGGFIRTYLSEASLCKESWEKRFNEELIKECDPLKTSYKLLEKENITNEITAIDLDIFVNSITLDSFPPLFDNLKSIVKKFRCCRWNHLQLPSTNYAIIRLLIEANYIDELMTLLDNPKEYGIFLDHHTAKLFLDKSIVAKSYADGAMCASHLMLQETFDSPVNVALSIFSCVKYLLVEDQEPIFKYTFSKEEPEDDEEVKVIFVPNNCKDEHFDLENDKHIVGKSLVYAAIHVDDAFIKHNATILGWSLFEKWTKLESAMKEARLQNIDLAPDVSSLVEKQLEMCENVELASDLKSCFESLNKDNKNEVNFVDYLDKYCQRITTDCEPNETTVQEKLYDDWSTKRLRLYHKTELQLERLTKTRLIANYKKELKLQKDYVNFFDNEDKWLQDMELKRQKYEAACNKLKKITISEKVDADYIIPEMSDMPQMMSKAMTKPKKVKRVNRVYPKYRNIENIEDTESRRHCGFRLYKNWRAIS